MPKHYNGQNLIDYVLILGLIAMVALGGIVMFSGQLKTFFDNRQADLNGSASSVSITTPGTTPSTQPVTGGGTTAGGTTGTGSTTIPAAGSNLSQELAAIIAQAPQLNSSAYIETVGVGGSTAAALDYLTTLAQKLEASGTITQQQSADLINLANLGYGMAHQESWIEKLSKDCGADSACFKNTLNGSWTDPSIMTKIANGQLNASNLLDPATAWSAGYATPFQAAYQQALTSGSMNNPDVKAVVTSMSEQIVKMFLATVVVVNKIDNNSVTPVEATSKLAADITKTNSDGICTVGSGIVNQGTNCL